MIILPRGYLYVSKFFTIQFPGGCGGGILILNAQEVCKVNGHLSASGQDGSSRGGGGAGGSIHITTSEFDGIGDIMVIYLQFQCDLLY